MKQPKQDQPIDQEEFIAQNDPDLQELDEQQEVASSNSHHDELEELKQKCAELEEKNKRVLADYRNLEHRAQTERVQYMKMANRWLIEALLEPLDFMEKATEHIEDKGLKMVTARFYQVLGDEGLKEIEALGQPFDEKTMEALDTAEGEENKVLKVISKGFKLHDQVVRHAKVVVGKKSN